MRRYKEDVRTALPKLRAHHYGTLCLDPPWSWVTGGPRQVGRVSSITGRPNISTMGTPYTRMKTADLVALGPMVRRVMKTDSHIYLWATNAAIPDAVYLLKEFGYRWVTMITWDKCRNGCAVYFQGVTEHMVFGIRGKPDFRFIDGKMAQGRTLISEKRTDHSRKPEIARIIIERVSAGPYLELFARRCPKNWDAIGLELEDQ